MLQWDTDLAKTLIEVEGASWDSTARTVGVSSKIVRAFGKRHGWNYHYVKVGENNKPAPTWNIELAKKLWHERPDRPVTEWWQEVGAESRRAVYRYAQTNGWVRRVDKPPKFVWGTAQGEALYRAGVEIVAIATQLGVPSTTVYDYARKHWGHKTRGELREEGKLTRDGELRVTLPPLPSLQVPVYRVKGLD